jgi:pectinesterase
MTVSKDTSDGDFTSIQEAVNSCKSFPDVRITIFVKKGTYKEKVEINSWNTRITLLGEDKDSTIITWNDAAGRKKNGTFWTYTMKVMGNDFRMKNITVENTAGQVGQAVALHVEADRVVIKNCKLLGNQDTLYAAGENARQLYDSCYIDGTTDYIFGPGTAVFRNCTLHSKKNSYITAASTPERLKFGYVFFNCKLTFDEDVTSVYLGRPWRKYAQTVFIQCDLGNKINARGWKEWSNKDMHSTTYYAEYQCVGTSADRSGRIEWSHELSDNEATAYTIENIFSGTCDVTSDEKKWYIE